MHLSEPITKQECIPVGCVPSAAVSRLLGGVCLPEGGGVCLVCPGVGGCLADTPPRTEFLTHACENITSLPFCNFVCVR